MPKWNFVLLFLLLVLAVVVAACAPTPTPAPTVLVGYVTDVGGIDDKTFNQTSWEGALRAEQEGLVDAEYLESNAAADYTPNVQAFVDRGAELIVAAGFLIGRDFATVAKTAQDVDFFIIDYSYPDCIPGVTEPPACDDQPIPNVVGSFFQTDEAAFLAGYLAAGMTETGKVATYGGIPIPPVTIFMDGFLAGVRYYNEVHGTEVKVLGWNGTEGTFTGNFESLEDGRELGESFLDEEADIILPVAGPVGLGTAAVMQERGVGMLIGVDVDQTVTSPEYTSLFLTSIRKRMENAVYAVVQSVLDGTFQGGTNYVATLANGGVDIAPFHEFEDDIPDDLKAELETIKAEIIAGTRSVKPADYPDTTTQ